MHDVGVVIDGLRLGGEVCKGDACLRFLSVDNSNRHRRVLGMCGFAACDADDSNFSLEVTGEDSDLSLRVLRLEVVGDFCGCEGLEEDNEATNDLEPFFLHLRTLNSLLRVFWGTRTFFAFRARGVSFSSHSRSVIFCLIIFSQVVSSYSNLG